jgi:dual specificity tyrosine-phosphorylation-regulated kinase 2/3/4
LTGRHDADGKYNVIHMKDYFLFRGHLCITFDMMHSDMYSALKRDQFKGFSLPRVQVRRDVTLSHSFPLVI